MTIDYEKLKNNDELTQWEAHIKTELSYTYPMTKTKDWKTIARVIEEETGKLGMIKNKELIQPQPQPKFKIGDEFWLLDMFREIHKATVLTVNSNVVLTGAISYVVRQDNGYQTTTWEKGMYPTKQSLIASQIVYWQSLLEPIPMREIQEAPFLGILSREQIQCAVDSVSKKECDHERLTVGCPVCDSYKMDPNNEYYKNEECRHEPEMDIGKDSRPRFEKGNNPKCKKCGEFYR